METMEGSRHSRTETPQKALVDTTQVPCHRFSQPRYLVTVVVDAIQVFVKRSPLDPEVRPLFAPSLCFPSSSHVLAGVAWRHPRVSVMSSLPHSCPDGGRVEVCVSLADLLGSSRHFSLVNLFRSGRCWYPEDLSGFCHGFWCLRVWFFWSTFFFTRDGCCSGVMDLWGYSTTTFWLSTTKGLPRSVRKGRWR